MPPVIACTNYDVAGSVWFTIARNRLCPNVLFIYLEINSVFSDTASSSEYVVLHVMIIRGIDIGILADLCQEQLRKTAKEHGQEASHQSDL
jgi:hypothetical protein